MPSAAPGPAESIRRFNRFYTRRIGVLQGGLLGSPFSLTEVRVLYEIAQRPQPTATELGKDLGLDAGYLSRILSRFAKLRLITRTPTKHDGRQSHLGLTKLGQKTFSDLNARSNRQIGDLVGHLPEAEQHRLAGVMRAAELLLTPPAEPRPAVILRDPKPGDLGWVVQRHGALYAHEYGWDRTFEALVAGIVADFGRKHDPARERCWVAEMDGLPVGCIFLVRQTDRIAKLRLLLVEPSARGAGVGRELVAACVDFARAAGYAKILLWTNSVLHAARRIYEQAGFHLVKSEPHHSFGHDLEGETWELPLNPKGGR